MDATEEDDAARLEWEEVWGKNSKHNCESRRRAAGAAKMIALALDLMVDDLDPDVARQHVFKCLAAYLIAGQPELISAVVEVRDDEAHLRYYDELEEMILNP